jgi:hypothetical protein
MNVFHSTRVEKGGEKYRGAQKSGKISECTHAERSGRIRAGVVEVLKASRAVYYLTWDMEGSLSSPVGDPLPGRTERRWATLSQTSSETASRNPWARILR